MTTREKMLEQALRLLVIDLKNRATERGIEYPQFAMECAEAALALPADDVGRARTAEVPVTGALGGDDVSRAFWHCRRYVLSAYTICCAAETDNQEEAKLLRIIDKGIAAYATITAPVTNARPSDNNGEARDAEREKRP